MRVPDLDKLLAVLRRRKVKKFQMAGNQIALEFCQPKSQGDEDTDVVGFKIDQEEDEDEEEDISSNLRKKRKS